MPPRVTRLPSPVNCLTTSDLDVPIATSDSPPQQLRSSPRRHSSLRGKTANKFRRRGRAATTTPKVPGLGHSKLIDTFRDAVSEGDLPPSKYSAFKYNFHEPEELPQPPEPEFEPEPLPRASLSPPPELAEKIPPWFRDVNGLRYAYPPEYPENPQWFDRMFGCVMRGHTDMRKLLNDLRQELTHLLAEMTLAEIEADESLAMYQELLQDIQRVAGTKFARAVTDVSGCWHLEESSQGVEVQYDPEKRERARQANRAAGGQNGAHADLAAAVSEIDDIDPSYGGEPSSPAPESPSHGPSMRAQKRRQERPAAPPPKWHRVFPPPPHSPDMQVRDSTLPPSSPIQSLPSSSSPSRRNNSDPVAPPDPASVTASVSLASINLELNFKPSSSNYISDPSQYVHDDSSGEDVDPPASGEPVDPNPAPAPAPANSIPSAYYAWSFPEEKCFPWNLPSTIPRRASEDDIKMAWSPEPAAEAEGSKKRAREEDDGDDGEDSGIIVPKRTAVGAESPFRDANESVEVAESVSAAIGAAHRAAAKAREKARPPTKSEREEREFMAHLRARFQDPNYFPYEG
ncbi:hypothetical protein LXA43DRAFT_1095960 [Ganoderma leucocontextum]|nr:hypothetical protein LXA43DRAFT_1095960 [Ganoderma leucocontextum]